MGDQGVDQGVIRIAWRGVDDQARRFVDHDQRVVLKDHAERDRLALGRRGTHLGQHQIEALARFDPVCGVRYRLAASREAAIKDQRLEARA